jgi:hypothetical protein
LASLLATQLGHLGTETFQLSPLVLAGVRVCGGAPRLAAGVRQRATSVPASCGSIRLLPLPSRHRAARRVSISRGPFRRFARTVSLPTIAAFFL